MAQSNSEAVFVNVLDIDPKRYEDLIQILKEGNSTIIRRFDGFISASILASADKRRVITVARWRSAEAIKKVGSNPIVAEYVKRTAAVANANPAVFSLVAEFSP